MKRVTLVVTDLTSVADEANCANVIALRSPVQQVLDALHVQGALPQGAADNADPRQLMHVSLSFINPMTVIRSQGQVNIMRYLPSTAVTT